MTNQNPDPRNAQETREIRDKRGDIDPFLPLFLPSFLPVRDSFSPTVRLTDGRQKFAKLNIDFVFAGREAREDSSEITVSKFIADSERKSTRLDLKRGREPT